MKVEKKNVNDCTVSLAIKADGAEIAAPVKKTLAAFMRDAVVPGFRKGKTPVAVIKQKFEQDLRRETVQACFSALLPKALEEAELKIIEVADVKDVVFDEANGFSCIAEVEVKPAFKLPKYKKLAIKIDEEKVTDDDVEKRIADYRAALARFEEAKEGDAIGDGDFVQFDYDGTLDGQPLSEIVPDEKAVCSAKGFWTQIEEGRFLPEILAALKGMKRGEEKKGVEVKFPDGPAPEALKGKTAVYDLKVTEFRRRQLPDDAELVQTAKVESIDKLRADFRERMERQAAESNANKRRNAAIDELLKQAEFDVPQSLVRTQIEEYLANLEKRMQQAGVGADYVEKNRDAILADATDHGTKQVRLVYVLAAIADAEKIEAAEEEIDKRCEELAAGAGEGKITKEDVRKRLEEHRQLSAIKDEIRAQKALDLVVAEAKK